MQFEGAVIREQGITFAVVIVRKAVIDFRQQAEQAIRTFSGAFPGMPVVLMAQDSRGTPTYYGRPDLSRFLANTPLGAIPWRRYTLN
jgi:hypothetical protein